MNVEQVPACVIGSARTALYKKVMAANLAMWCLPGLGDASTAALNIGVPSFFI